MAYRATLSGPFGGGTGPATAHPIDVGQILDSITNGASTLIQNTYARQRGRAEMELAKQKAEQEAQRYTEQNRINEQRYREQNERETQRAREQQKLERLKIRMQAAQNGVTLGPEFDEPSDTAPTSIPQAMAAAPAVQPASAESLDNNAMVPPAPSGPPIAQAIQAAAPRTTGYNPENDPRIKRAVAQQKAVEQVKLNMAPLMASADSAKAVNTAKGLIPVHVAQLQAEAPVKTAQELQVAREKQKIADDAPPQVRAEANEFMKENKLLTDAVPAYAAAKNAFAEAKTGNPAALKSALLNFAAVSDPKLRLTQGLVNMVTQVDPSVAGRLDLALDRLSSGKLPPQILENMERMVERTHATQRALFEQRRAEAVGRHAAVDRHLPSAASLFDVPGITTATPHGAAHPVMSKYGITPSTP